MNRLYIAVTIVVVSGLAIWWGMSRIPSQDNHAPIGGQPATVAPSAPPVESTKLPEARPNPEPTAGFQAQLLNTQRELPTESQVMKSPDYDPHGLPEEVLEATGKLVEIKQAVIKDPSKFLAAKTFFDDCIRNEKVMLSVRAMCFRQLTQTAGAIKQVLNLKNYPENIKRLVKTLDEP